MPGTDQLEPNRVDTRQTGVCEPGPADRLGHHGDGPTVHPGAAVASTPVELGVAGAAAACPVTCAACDGGLNHHWKRVPHTAPHTTEKRTIDPAINERSMGS